jgi:hypothetical protein
MNRSIPPSRKHLLATFLAAAMALGIAGCDDGNSSPPVANAGTAQSVTTGTTVTLDASASTDANGDSLTYTWSIVSRPAGSTATINGASTVKPTFTPDLPGTYVAKVAVSDGSSTTEATVSLTASDVLGFNAIPDPFPANYASYSLNAYSIKSIGDQVTLKVGSPHTLATFSVGLSSYACQSGTYTSGCASAAGATFTAPVTVRFFNTAGTLLGAQTQLITMPYRPAVDPTCPIPANFQYRAADGNCYTGVVFKATIDLRSLKIAVPDSFYYDVQYNTMTAGPAPTGVAGPIDSVNVGVLDAPPNAPTTGSDPKPSLIRWDGADDTDLTDLYIVPAQIIMQAP